MSRRSSREEIFKSYYSSFDEVSMYNKTYMKVSKKLIVKTNRKKITEKKGRFQLKHISMLYKRYDTSV